jgi:hypothetical protein
MEMHVSTLQPMLVHHGAMAWHHSWRMSDYFHMVITNKTAVKTVLVHAHVAWKS